MWIPGYKTICMMLQIKIQDTIDDKSPFLPIVCLLLTVVDHVMISNVKISLLLYDKFDP